MPREPAVQHVKLRLHPVDEVPLAKRRLLAVVRFDLFKFLKLCLTDDLTFPNVRRFRRRRVAVDDAVEMPRHMPARINNLELTARLRVARQQRRTWRRLDTRSDDVLAAYTVINRRKPARWYPSRCRPQPAVPLTPWTVAAAAHAEMQSRRLGNLAAFHFGVRSR